MFENSTPSIPDFSNLVGQVGEHFDQSTDFTCAVVSQQMILSDFGINMSEYDLMYQGAQNGWLTENGTLLQDMGKLLELNGVPTRTVENGNLNSLINELAHGHKVIVAVDSGELWGGPSFWQKLTGIDFGGPDHALVVSGLDFSDPKNPKVILNDPGAGAGEPQIYSLDRFMNAWDDSNFLYCATTVTPEDLQHLGTGFNADTGIYGTPEDWFDFFFRIGWNVGVAITDIQATGGTMYTTVAVMDIFSAVNEYQHLFG